MCDIGGDGADNEDDGGPYRVVGDEGPSMEECGFEESDCGFGSEFWWVADYQGDGLEDRGSGWHDVGTAAGGVPVPSVLCTR